MYKHNKYQYVIFLLNSILDICLKVVWMFQQHDFKILQGFALPSEAQTYII